MRRPPTSKMKTVFEAALGAALVVVIDADGPDRHVLDLSSTRAHPLWSAVSPWMTRGLFAAIARLLWSACSWLTVIGVGTQPGRQLVADPLRDRIDEDAGPGRGLEQEAGLAVPGQLADHRRAGRVRRARRAPAAATSARSATRSRRRRRPSDYHYNAAVKLRRHVRGTPERRPGAALLAGGRGGAGPQDAGRDPGGAADGAGRLHHEGRRAASRSTSARRRSCATGCGSTSSRRRGTAATSCRCSTASSSTSRRSSPATRRRRCCWRTR